MFKIILLVVCVFIVWASVGYFLSKWWPIPSNNPWANTSQTGAVTTVWVVVERPPFNPINIGNIKTVEDVKDFVNNEQVAHVLSFLALKTNNQFIWDRYWDEIYLNNKEKLGDSFIVKVKGLFRPIIEKKLNIWDSSDILFDGSIFFSNAPLSEKLDACEIYHKDSTWEKDQKILYCKNLSYFYAAISDDKQICSSIVDDVAGQNIREYCTKIASIK